MIIRIHISTIHKIQTTSMKRSMRNKRHTFDSSFRSKQHRVAPILDALISLNPGRTSNSIESLEWSVSIDRSLSDQVSNKRQSFVTKKGKRKNIEWYSTRFYSGRSFPLYAPATHTERIQMKFAFQMDSPSHALTRIKYISHECTLQDYHSSYEMEFQVYIYIYIHTPGIKASLHLWLSFTDRLTDCTGPQYIALTFRMKRHIPWSGEWYYGAGNESTRSGGENLLFNRFCVKSK